MVEEERVLFGMGCFYASQELLDSIPGVISTRVGAAGLGPIESACGCMETNSPQAPNEVVEVVFDPAQLTFRRLLKIFWTSQDHSNPEGPYLSGYRSQIV